MHKNQLTGVSRCFAAKNITVTKMFLCCLNLISILDVYHFESYQYLFSFQFCIIDSHDSFVYFFFNLYAFISFQVV